MKKPLPAVIVEALGWVYVALSVAVVVGAVLSLHGTLGRPNWLLFIWPLLSPLALAVGMVVALRRGRCAWFLGPHAFLCALVGLFIVAGLVEAQTAALLAWGVGDLVLLVAPFVLLCLPVSRRWFSEKAGGAPGLRIRTRIVCAALLVLFLLALSRWIVIGHAAQQEKRKYAKPELIFRDGIPQPRPDTYYLTPTGCLDLVVQPPVCGN